MTFCDVNVPLTDVNVQQLLERGGHARARHAFGDAGHKRIDRVVAFFDAKLSFTQRRSDSLQLFEEVKLKLSFQYAYWTPDDDIDQSAASFPTDGSFRVAPPADELVQHLAAVQLSTMATKGAAEFVDPVDGDDDDDGAGNEAPAAAAPPSSSSAAAAAAAPSGH